MSEIEHPRSRRRPLSASTPSRAARMYRDADRAEGRRSIGDPSEGLRTFVDGEAAPAETSPQGELEFDLDVVQRELRRLAHTCPPGQLKELWMSLEKIVEIIGQLMEVKSGDEQVVAGLSDIFAHIQLEVQQALLLQHPRSSPG